MSAYARHCLHSICYLPNTSVVPLQGKGYHPHIAVRHLSLEKLSRLHRARIQTQVNHIPVSFFCSQVNHIFSLEE